MAWRIHSWSPERGRGEVISPQLGPWGFGAAENPRGVDFEVGEPVVVELEGPTDAGRVRSVVPCRQRQPERTEIAELAELHARRPVDVRVETWTEEVLRLWVGDCCEACSEVWWRLTFRRPSGPAFDADRDDLSMPLLRYASDGEIAEHALEVSADRRAYCVVTDHGSGPDGPRFYLVADVLEVDRGESRSSLGPHHSG